MQKLNFNKIVEDIIENDPRYDMKAYAFVREGLDYTLKVLKRNTNKTVHAHVSGQELLEGLRQYTLKEFGPMSKMVLNEWGIRKCKDFGHIVFHLVENGILGKSENDRLDDFDEIWNFEEAFVKPFLPNPLPKRKQSANEEFSQESLFPLPRTQKKKKSPSKKSSDD